jgi:FG-GAP repeat
VVVGPYVYDLDSPTPSIASVTLPRAGAGISGALIAAGLVTYDTGPPFAGSMEVYDLRSKTPTIPVAITPAPAWANMSGMSVAIDGTTVAVGAPFDDGVMLDKGAVFIFGPAPPPADTDSDGLLDSWELTYWPSIVGHGAVDDFDQDGSTELLEFAFGLDPTVPDAGGLPRVTVAKGYLTMTLSKRPGVTYEVQSGGTVLVGRADSFNSATTTVLIDNATTLRVRDNVLIGASPARFMRVKVTAALKGDRDPSGRLICDGRFPSPLGWAEGWRPLGPRCWCSIGYR